MPGIKLMMQNEEGQYRNMAHALKYEGSYAYLQSTKGCLPVGASERHICLTNIIRVKVSKQTLIT